MPKPRIQISRTVAGLGRPPLAPAAASVNIAYLWAEVRPSADARQLASSAFDLGTPTIASVSSNGSMISVGQSADAASAYGYVLRGLRPKEGAVGRLCGIR